MKIAINEKYRYITKQDCSDYKDFINQSKIVLTFTEWVMREKFKTHSVIDVTNKVYEKEGLTFKHFKKVNDIYKFDQSKYTIEKTLKYNKEKLQHFKNRVAEEKVQKDYDEIAGIENDYAWPQEDMEEFRTLLDNERRE